MATQPSCRTCSANGYYDCAFPEIHGASPLAKNLWRDAVATARQQAAEYSGVVPLRIETEHWSQTEWTDEDLIDEDPPEEHGATPKQFAYFMQQIAYRETQGKAISPMLREAESLGFDLDDRLTLFSVINTLIAHGATTKKGTP